MTRLPDSRQLVPSGLDNKVSSRPKNQLACSVLVVMIRQLKFVGAKSVLLLLPLMLIRADSTNSRRQVRHTRTQLAKRMMRL